jgi:hypothetical protein
MPPGRRDRATRRRLILAVALAATGLVACADEIAVAPLPIESAVTTTPAAPATRTALPSPTTTAPPQPPRPPRIRQRPSASPTAEPTRESSCYGRVVYELEVAETEFAVLGPLCFSTGAVLRLQGIGPGLVTVDPESLVAQSYEAAVYDITFLRPGTVEVTIPHDERIDTVTVVVVS